MAATGRIGAFALLLLDPDLFNRNAFRLSGADVDGASDTGSLSLEGCRDMVWPASSNLRFADTTLLATGETTYSFGIRASMRG